MEPEERALLADLLALEHATEHELHAAFEALAREYPNAERLRAVLTARLGEPDLSAPDTTATFQAICQELWRRGAWEEPTTQHPTSVGARRGVPRPNAGRATRFMTGGTRRSIVWSAVATLIVVVGATLFGWHTGVLHRSGRTGLPPAVYTTANGQRANITLSDGTTVTLDVASRLEVPADYPVGDYTVRLQGEALFTATHHAGRPLTVFAGATTTQVLGTSFLVRHYATDPTTTVAVEEGKVMVQRGTARPVVVAADQQVVLDQGREVTVQPMDSNAFAFTTGVLRISGLSLRDAIMELDRWYDTDIRLGDPSLATRQIAGGFTAGSLSELATILEMTFDVRVVRDGRTLTLFPR